MDRLHFGTRSRRRARRARIKRIAVAIWLLAIVAGVPGATAVLDWTRSLLGGSEQTVTSAQVQDALQVSAAKELKSELHTKQERSENDAVPASPGSIEAVIYEAAAEFGLDGSYLLSVAVCESTLNPAAYNPAGSHGLFQFDQSTWSAYGYGSIYDPVAQARTAARLIAAGQSSRWPNCA